MQAFNSRLGDRWELEWNEGKEGRGLRKLESAGAGNRGVATYRGLAQQHTSILVQLRTDRSILNADLFKRRVVDSPLCDCGELETREHFLLACRHHHTARAQMTRCLVSNKLNPTDINTLLCDRRAQKHVLRFVNDSERFPARYWRRIEEKE